MTGEILFVFVVIGAAGVLFASGKIRLDIVALLVVLALYLGGALTVREVLAGFGDPVVIMVACLLIIGEMLTRTGVAHSVGNWITRRAGDSEVRLITLLIVVVALLGCFMSNTAVVAVFIPVVLNIANRTNLNVSHLLLPLAYAGLISGMLTLIATPPNLVVSAELVRSGFEPFGFFSFTPVGAAVVVVFVGYMLLAGRHLLPGERVAKPTTASRKARDLLEEFELMGTARRFRVSANSVFVGQTLAEAEIGSRYGARVIIHERSHRLGLRFTPAPPRELEIRGGDVLVLQVSPESIERLAKDGRLQELPITDAQRALWIRDAGVAKVLIHPESKLIGSTLRESGFRSIYGVHVLGLRRGGRLVGSFLDERLESGDAMLVIGPWKRITQLQSELHDFVVLALPAEIDQVAPTWRRAPVALAILAIMIVLSAFEIVPVAIAVLIAALLAVFARCLSMGQGYRAIRWSTVVLIAGLLPVARAMVKSGGVDLIVEQLVNAVGSSGPYVMLSALFALTVALGTVLSNTATAVLLAPIAIRAAAALEVSPYAFAMTVAIAASSAFITPVSSPAVTLVVGPGKYHVPDLLKVGLPMLILTWLVTILVIPRLFPFG